MCCDVCLCLATWPPGKMKDVIFVVVVFDDSVPLLWPCVVS